MTESERRLKKRVQLVVTGAVAVFFVLVTVLVFQLAVRMNQRNEETVLKAEKARLEQALEDSEAAIKYFGSPEFIDDYALKVLGWGKTGQKIFEKK